ncbi:MAG: site-specific DNA-methyltransferase, partial [Sphaerochaeta sp.]|nr:site-specific DNA-methyltransferase [Sphaerochaeta sp.]
RWGFNLAQLILYYGKDPRAGKDSYQSSVEGHNDSVVDIKNILHPCPKPLKFTKWLVIKGTKEGDTVLDPFMGSGTTGVACVQTGRNFIGCEIDPAYFAIAEKRIREAQMQLRFDGM